MRQEVLCVDKVPVAASVGRSGRRAAAQSDIAGVAEVARRAQQSTGCVAVARLSCVQETVVESVGDACDDADIESGAVVDWIVGCWRKRVIASTLRSGERE